MLFYLRFIALSNILSIELIDFLSSIFIVGSIQVQSIQVWVFQVNHFAIVYFKLDQSEYSFIVWTDHFQYVFSQIKVVFG